MDTNFPYDKGGETLAEVIEGIWENLNVPDKKVGRVMVLAKEGFEEICEHIAEWQSRNMTK
jgi:hypothetical protein